MKISYELEQGYIDVWNKESEEWDRYVKVTNNKKQKIIQGLKTYKDYLKDLNEDEDYHNEVETEYLQRLSLVIIDVINVLESKGE